MLNLAILHSNIKSMSLVFSNEQGIKTTSTFWVLKSSFGHSDVSVTKSMCHPFCSNGYFSFSSVDDQERTPSKMPKLLLTHGGSLCWHFLDYPLKIPILENIPPVPVQERFYKNIIC